MQTIDLELDGEALLIRVMSADGQVSSHIVHAVGPNGSLAYFTGGPGVLIPQSEPAATSASIAGARERLAGASTD